MEHWESNPGQLGREAYVNHCAMLPPPPPQHALDLKPGLQ